jgi:hypothetical protein
MPNLTILTIFTGNTGDPKIFSEILGLYNKKGGGKLFGDELMIGSVRAQASRLKDILSQIENDDKWKDHSSYYAKEMQEIE